MKKNTGPLHCETFYHIFNRGINRENIFKEERNYSFFLEKYVKYVQPIASTYAFSLLKNHFHFLIRTRSEEEIKAASTSKMEYEAGEIVSKKFSDLFNGYAQSINKEFNRTGGLFETPFRRIAVTNDEYVTGLIYYIHINAQKHGLVDDFRCHNHSSYPIYLDNSSTFLERKLGIEWFGDVNSFIAQHTEWADERFSCVHSLLGDFEV